MRIVFMGTPEFSVPILKEVAQFHEVVLVVTQPDKLVGRKKTLEESPVKRCAKELGLEVFQPTKIKEEYQPVLDKNPDLIITAAFGQFIPEVVLNAPKYKAINVHGSLLPKYRGGSPIQSSIINGEEYTGITIMYMAKKMDSGDIIAQEKVQILDSDDNGSMFEKLSIVGRDLLMKVLPTIEDETVKSYPQDELEATFAYNISHEDQFIDWNKTSREIFNKVRGLSPEPTALTSINNIIIKIYKTSIVEYEGTEAPGTVVKMNKALWVKTTDGAVSIDILQVSGKNKMDAKSFLNGQKLLELGSQLENTII